jgi:hypothetical protein
LFSLLIFISFDIKSSPMSALPQAKAYIDSIAISSSLNNLSL